MQRRNWLSLVFQYLSVLSVAAVLRYPDASFESRFPLHLDHCGTGPFDRSSASCVARLRHHLLEDGDCNRVICDNIATSTPIEAYANQSDWMPFKNFCGNLKELFTYVYDLGTELLGRPSNDDDERLILQYWQAFRSSAKLWMNVRDVQGAPGYANTTLSVLQRHGAAVFDLFRFLPTGETATANWFLSLAVETARRLQLLIENVSLTLLLNFHIAQLEYNSRLQRGANYVYDLYGDVDSIKVIFHEIPGKRWDSLQHLLHWLGITGRDVAMAEIGVEAANTSQRLLERHPRLSYLGVDPYVNNDGLHDDVKRRLSMHLTSGRFVLHRDRSLDVAVRIPGESLDLVFLDARHDYEAVTSDIQAWRPKVRSGGVLCGHDFSWMFPTVAMAVYAAAPSMPSKTIHLAPDGVWWFYL